MKKGLLLLLVMVSVHAGAQVKNTMPDIKGLTHTAFKQLEDGTEAQLQLAYDTVLFVRGDEAYLRSGDGGAIMFYQSGLSLETGQMVVGSVTGRKETHDGMAVFVGTDKTRADDYSVVTKFSIDGYEHQLQFEREQQPQPVNVDDYVADLVEIDSAQVTTTDAAARSFTVSSPWLGSREMTVVDKYDYCEEVPTVGYLYRHVRGILTTTDAGSLRLYLVKPMGDGIPVSISSPVPSRLRISPLYDLQGRRLTDRPARGVYIEDGRKRVVK